MNQPSPFELYERQLVPALFTPAAQELIRVAKPLRGERVLDVACGTGIVARMVAPLVGETGAVTGVDLTPPMLAVARSIRSSAGAPISWVEGSALALPFEDQAFDLVTCQNGIQFFPDRALALREMRRVLGTTGRAVIGVNQGFDTNPVYGQFNDVLKQHTGLPILAQPFCFGSSAALRLLYTDAGFEKVDVKSVTLSVRFPDERAFVTATLMASGAVMPAFREIDADKRAALIDPIYDDMRAIFAPYRQGSEVVFQLNMNIGCGIA